MGNASFVDGSMMKKKGILTKALSQVPDGKMFLKTGFVLNVVLEKKILI